MAKIEDMDEFLRRFERKEAKRRGNKTTTPKHRQSRTRLYSIWSAMLKRCYSPISPNYRYYGGRGIIVCERWKTYENFAADMGQPPPGMSIDRIDNFDGYHPGNCRWATAVEQARNKRPRTTERAKIGTRKATPRPKPHK